MPRKVISGREDYADDENAEQDRPTDFFGGMQDHLLHVPRRLIVVHEVPVDVFHNDQRSVRNHADRDGQSAERH
jgi:hypothetical protein